MGKCMMHYPVGCLVVSNCCALVSLPLLASGEGGGRSQQVVRNQPVETYGQLGGIAAAGP